MMITLGRRTELHHHIVDASSYKRPHSQQNLGWVFNEQRCPPQNRVGWSVNTLPMFMQKHCMNSYCSNILFYSWDVQSNHVLQKCIAGIKRRLDESATSDP